MSTTDGAIDQKLFYDLEWIYHCLLPKIVMQMKHLPFSAQIKQHNRYFSIVNNLKLWIAPSFCQKSEFVKITSKQL